MSRTTREELLSKLQWRYSHRNRQGKIQMLNDFCDDHGYERKYAIKLLGDTMSKPTGRCHPGPESKYLVIEPVVREIWKAAEMPCGKRLKPALKPWLPHYQRHYGKLSTKQRQLINQVSAATLDRLLAPQRASLQLKGRCGTKPGSLLKSQIPIRTDNWDINQPGFLEADTVAHCGGSLAGNFIWSVTYTDIFSGWTEGRAVWNKGAEGIVKVTRDVEESLPFILLGFDTDNGSEFLNAHLWKYFTTRKLKVQFTRSRPYHKNDNAHVEQKNWMWPRQLLGYQRLEQACLVDPINALFKEAWGPLHNFYIPSVKLKYKWREGSRWKRKYHEATTAYERLINQSKMGRKEKRELKDQFESLDPFNLKKEIEGRLKKIFKQIISTNN